MGKIKIKAWKLNESIEKRMFKKRVSDRIEGTNAVIMLVCQMHC